MPLRQRSGARSSTSASTRTEWASKSGDMLPSVPESVDALRADLHKKGVEGHVQDAFNNLASCLVLLNSSSPSVQMIRKLCAVLRQPPLPFYVACLQPALRLSSSVLSTVLGRLCDAHSVADGSLCAAWDETAEVILSGILDFLDQKDVSNGESDSAVWEVLYRTICEFFFLDSGRGLPVFSIPLCLSAYNTLTEIAAMQITIRDALRHRDILGGERLGAAISETRDYLLLEALLMLFARLLPPTHNTSQGKFRRMKFVKDVLGSQKLFKCNTELLDIMQKTSGTHWDDVAAQIFDALSRTDVTYPQPFSIDEIDVCGRPFPQPLATDRLILDSKGLLANIVVENDDTCESLQVPYSQIRMITLDSSEKNAPKGKTLIMVYLTSPPLVVNAQMKYPDTSRLYAKFSLQSDAVARFMEALRRRGVGKLSFLNPMTRVERTRKSISIGSGFKFVNECSPIPPTASFEGKLQRVNQVYKTDVEDLTMPVAFSASHADDANSLPMRDPGPAFNDENPVAKLFESAVAENNLSSGNSTSQMFGGGCELSEISEFESDNNVTDEWKPTGVAASCSDEAKPRRHEIDRMGLNESPGAVSKKIENSSTSTSISVDNTKGNTRRSPQSGQPPLASKSPVFGSSSSTQIDPSPQPSPKINTLLPPASTEGVGDLSVASKNYFVDADRQSETGINECIPSYPEPITAFVGKSQIGPTEDGLEQRAGSFTMTSDVTKKVHSRIDVEKDANAPSKITGSRRKRESVTPLSKATIYAGDEAMPPRKKVKRRPKTAGNGRVGEFVELSELKSSCQGTRRSSRINKIQTTMTGGNRANVVRGKAQKTVGHKKSVNTTLQDTGVRNSRSKLLIPGLHLEASVTMEPASDNQPSFVELNSGDVTPEPSRHQEFKARGNLICESSLCGAEELRGDRNFTQQTASDATQCVQEQFCTKAEEIDGEDLVSNFCIVQNEVSNVPDVVKDSISLKESEDIVESTPRMGTFTIDLTVDDSPTRKTSGPREASSDLLHSEADTRAKLRPQLFDGVVAEDPALVSSPRHRCRCVTFASPIEYVLNQRVKSRTQISPSSHQPSSPSENNSPSPLRIPTGTMNMKREQFDRITPGVTLENSKLLKGSLPDQTASDDEVQDIVEVLNEIQAVIIKGISDKFRNVKKDVRHGRDELIQRVLDELRGMVAENAKYFNGLLRLEEDYHKNSKAITRCWEDLIYCNDAITLQYQNHLKEHDQKKSTRTFPKSLQTPQPSFAHHCADA